MSAGIAEGGEIGIRPAAEADLSSINDIYNFYVDHSTCTYQTQPETMADRAAWFTAHGEGYPVFVAERDGKIVGWGSISRFHPRAGYRFAVENSIYLRKDSRRMGIGARLLELLIRESRRLGYHTIIAGISAEQIASIELHRKFGFIEAGRLREVGYKFDQWLDVIYMQLRL